MDLSRLLTELRLERDRLDQAIRSLGRLAGELPEKANSPDGRDQRPVRSRRLEKRHEPTGPADKMSREYVKRRTTGGDSF